MKKDSGVWFYIPLPRAQGAEAVPAPGHLLSRERVGESRINIFLGAPECVEVVMEICRKPQEVLSYDGHLILGIMFGYRRLGQCRRYLQR